MKKYLLLLVLPFLVSVSPPVTPTFPDIVSFGTPDEVQAAVRAGADVHARNALGQTPLFLAAWRNADPGVISALLDAGARVNEGSNKRSTPLMIASGYNANPAVIEELVAAGARLEDRNEDGWTALHYAALFSSNPRVIAALAQAGADLSAMDKHGLTAVMLAAQMNANPGAMAALLAAGARTDDPGATGCTPVLLASSSNANPQVVSLLLKAGAEANVRDTRQGWGIIIGGLAYSHPEITRPEERLFAMARSGALAGGLTPLMWAALFTTSPAVIDLLLDAGADRDARTTGGATARDCAALNPRLQGTPELAALSGAR